MTKKMGYQPQKVGFQLASEGGFTNKSRVWRSLRRPKRNTAGVAGALIGTALKAAAAAAVAAAWLWTGIVQKRALRSDFQ